MDYTGFKKTMAQLGMSEEDIVVVQDYGHEDNRIWTLLYKDQTYLVGIRDSGLLRKIAGHDQFVFRSSGILLAYLERDVTQRIRSYGTFIDKIRKEFT